MKNNLKILIGLVTITFILNLVWENLQMTLYTGYAPHILWGINCLVATLGDILIVLVMYAVVAIKSGKFNWAKNYKRADIFLFLGLGVLIAIFFEKYALATNRYEYSSSMPVIPLIKVGLIPVLQMLILPIVSIEIIKKFN